VPPDPPPDPPVKCKSRDGLSKAGCVKPEVGFNAQYIRTRDNNDYSDTAYRRPTVTVVSSRDGLDRYWAGNGYPWPVYKPALEKYSDDYFADSSIVIVRVTEGSGSIRHEVKSVRENGDLLIDRLLPNEGTDDMAVWSILIELGNDIKAAPFRATFNDVYTTPLITNCLGESGLSKKNCG